MNTQELREIIKDYLKNTQHADTDICFERYDLVKFGVNKKRFEELYDEIIEAVKWQYDDHAESHGLWFNFI